MTLFRRIRSFLPGEAGGAAVEMGLLVGILTIPFLNVVDLAVYAYKSVQVGTAAHAGVEAAYATCSGLSQWPVIANCSGVSDTITKAVQSTSLGTNIAVSKTNITEGYYCTGTNGSLYLVSSSVNASTGGSPTGVPTTCASATPPSGVTWSNSADKPGDYVKVVVTYSYVSIFPTASAVKLLLPTITQTDMIRII